MRTSTGGTDRTRRFRSRWQPRRWLRLGAVLVSASILMLAVAPSPASAYQLTGQRWSDVLTVPNAIISQINCSGTGTAWDSARNGWNVTPTRVWIDRTATSPNIQLFDVSNSSVGWDGQATWWSTNNIITRVEARLNCRYTRNNSAATNRGIASHELGHAVGLAHASGCVVMISYTHGSGGRASCGVTAPRQDDINGVNAIYGPLAPTVENSSVDVARAVSEAASGVNLDVSWARGYGTLSEMTRDADAIVIGHVSTVAGSTIVDGLPFTDFNYAIDEWVAAPRGETDPPSEIVIHQTGGVQDGQTVQVTHDPLMVQGEQTVLFLRQYAPGRYYALAGPTGRLMMSGDGAQLAQLAGAIPLDGLSPSRAMTLRAVAQELKTAGTSAKSVLVTPSS